MWRGAGLYHSEKSKNWVIQHIYEPIKTKTLNYLMKL